MPEKSKREKKTFDIISLFYRRLQEGANMNKMKKYVIGSKSIACLLRHVNDCGYLNKCDRTVDILSKHYLTEKDRERFSIVSKEFEKEDRCAELYCLVLDEVLDSFAKETKENIIDHKMRYEESEIEEIAKECGLTISYKQSGTDPQGIIGLLAVRESNSEEMLFNIEYLINEN